MDTQQHSAVEQKMLAGLKFCARCKASIPESEFHDGHALHMGNKNIHVECLLKRSGWIPALALVLAVVALGLGVYGLTGAGGDGDGSHAAAAPAVTPADLQGALDRARAAEGRAAALEADLQGMKAETSRLLAESRTQATAEREALAKGLQDGWSKAAAAAEARLANAEAALGEVGSLNSKFTSLAQALTDIRKDLAALRSKVEAPPSPPDGR